MKGTLLTMFATMVLLTLFAGCGKSEAPTPAPAAPVPPAAATSEEPAAVNPETFKGAKLSEVTAALGKPLARKKVGQSEKLFYPEYTITTLDGVTVAEVERDEGRLTTAAPTAAEAGSVPELLVISNGGQEVKLESVVVKGKITIVDFFAEWCGPCRHIGPILETMAGNDPDVVLRKIDIVNWETPVVKQHGIRSVPNVRVFGKDGKQIGQSSSDPSEVAKYIAQAKK